MSEEEIEVKRKSAEVEALLERKDKINALIVSLQNPPVNSKSDDLKESCAATVEKVLSVFSESDLSPAVSALNLDNCDILMKYIYKLMARANNNNALLLKLHAEVLSKAGVGSIVRVLTDRKTV